MSSPKRCEVMNLNEVLITMDPKLKDSYNNLPKLRYVRVIVFYSYYSRHFRFVTLEGFGSRAPTEGLVLYSGWRELLAPNGNPRLVATLSDNVFNHLMLCLRSFIKRLITFVSSGPYVNPSRYDPTFLYNGPGPYSNSGTFICNDTGSLLMLLSVGRCVKSCLMRPVNAPTAKGKDQNYFKHIDVKLHTVEFERLASALGMVSHQSTVNTSLENGNDLRFTTRSNPAPDGEYTIRNRPLSFTEFLQFSWIIFIRTGNQPVRIASSQGHVVQPCQWYQGSAASCAFPRW